MDCEVSLDITLSIGAGGQKHEAGGMMGTVLSGMVGNTYAAKARKERKRPKV